MTVLVVDDPSDVCTDAIVDVLSERGDVFRVDAGDFPQLLSLEASIMLGGGVYGWSGSLRYGHKVVGLESISAVYYNRPTRFRLAESLSEPERDFGYEEARAGFGGVLLSLQCLWMNHPSRSADAEYKPVQMAVARRVGLAIPRTLITNDPEKARNFINTTSAGVVCKPLRRGWITESEDFFLIGTTKLTPGDVGHIQRVTATANLFQEWIPKNFDVRTTVVGTHIFSVAIHAQTPESFIDWRRDYGNLRYEKITTPPEIAKQIRHYMASLGLTYGAFDFSVDQKDQWVFLECNPSGQWGWLQDEARVPIAQAIANFLAKSERAG